MPEAAEHGTAESSETPEAPALSQTKPSGERPCKLRNFFNHLAEANDYPGEFDSTRSPAFDLELIRQSLWERVDFSQSGKPRTSKTREDVMAEVGARNGSSFTQLAALGFALRRAWSDTKGDAVQSYPFQAGSLLVVDRYFQVRIYGDACDGHVAELRDTGGNYTRPAALEPDQVGFDCTRDRRVLDTPPSQTVVQALLRERQSAFPSAQLVHAVFPRSITPRIREVQHVNGQCTVKYLAIFPELNTCAGAKASLIEAPSPPTCCTARACDNDVAFYFLALVDALSLRLSAQVKNHIRPGGYLKLTGYPYDEGKETLITRSTTEHSLKRALESGPGWAGTDHAACDPPVDDTHAQCWFGSGGTQFSVYFERNGKTERWYATEIRGARH